MTTKAAAVPDEGLRRDTAELYRALNIFIRVYQFRDRDRICCHDISVTQCYAMEAIARRGPLSLNDLAAELYLDKSTASRVVAALERKGYLRREPHPEDGRSLLHHLTPAGRRLHDRIEHEIVDEEMALLAEFPSDTRRAMARAVTKLAAAAASRVEASGGSCCRVTP